MLPHIVCLGAQNNFTFFNIWLQKQEEDYKKFFKKTVALLILWNKTEKMFCNIGLKAYRHAIVSYTLAWFFHKTDSKIDLDKTFYEVCDEYFFELLILKLRVKIFKS